ncbi:uncharacterized protein AB675_10050 [Cyphellophora attinorum]|uniref:Uncharacterized protein n=1 Tax=Cyphellophora attinorum TaxID=1664694 RepID=A0A0N0NJ90_9EURO|nr:uncharacterized protein AB675_10050 [Phialophora attinorum]KPI36638.1 hypothetical protein AB675_10050 [Phialophora attinorum]
MAMQYINYIKNRTPFATKSEAPVLSEDDEAFLNKITSEENPPALPPRPDAENASLLPFKDAQFALMDGAQNIPLPDTPQVEMTEEPLGEKSLTNAAAKPRSTWSWLRRDSRDTGRGKAATDLAEVAQGLKDADAKPNEDNVVPDAEAKKEEEDMAEVLDSLNLAAVNNRVFSISDETQELLQKFNQIVKDLINGVPTAYDDLEKLLTLGDDQLTKTFQAMPSFLQTLITKLPQSMTAGLVLADGGCNAGKAAATAKKMGFKTPSLKDLTGKPAAVASLLRSIIMYLRTRFPAFLGMNVLWSLAMFVLLFVFWYCHKRGKEVRLEKERDLTEQEVSRLDDEYRATHPGGTIKTTAAPDATIDEVQAGIDEARKETATSEAATTTEKVTAS